MPVLETERLFLREFNGDDAYFVVTLLNEASFLQFIGDKNVRNLDDARQYILNGPVASYERNGFGLYMVEMKDTHVPAGMCGLLKRDDLPHPDIGFAFLPYFWNKGFAFEAATAVLKHARERFQFDRILALVNPDNEASIKLLQRLGFTFERLKDEVQVFALDYAVE